MYPTPVDENKVNKKMQDLLNMQMDSADAAGEDVKEIPHNAPFTSNSKSTLMTFTQMLESLDAVEGAIGADTKDIMDHDVEKAPVDEDALIQELNKLFTPVLVMQKFEKDVSDESMRKMESAGVLTERSIIKFDDEARMAQLIAVCAKLIAKQKNTEAWQLYKKASVLKKKAGLDLQKQEYNDAKALAQKYLVNVSTTSTSGVARQAATELLPQTQH